MERLKKKLKSRAGESIGEVLIALLVSGLALMMLAGAITTSSGLINKGKEKQADYYAENTKLSTMEGSGDSGNIVLEESGSEISSYSILYYENKTFSNTPIISYKQNGS